MCVIRFSLCALVQNINQEFLSILQRKLSARSDRVKCVDLHPTEPWMLASLYNGNVHVWDHESQVFMRLSVYNTSLAQSHSDS